MAIAASPFLRAQRIFPTWQVDERAALYSIIGGIPAYLKWLDPTVGLVENIRDVMLSPSSMFMAEPQFLLYDEFQNPQTYLAILQAVSSGNHTLGEISKAALLERTSLPRFLQRLQALQLVHRRLPVTLRRAEQKSRAKEGITSPIRFSVFIFAFLHRTRIHLCRNKKRLLISNQSCAHLWE